MAASEDEAIFAAAKALYYTCSDEEVRIRCLEREEYYQDLRNYERAIEQERSEREKEREQQRLEHEQDLRNYEKAIAEKEQDYRQVAAENEKLRAEIERLKNS